MNSLRPQEIQALIEQIDQLIIHLRQKRKLVQTDLRQLKTVLFHLDNLLNRLNQTSHLDPLLKADLNRYLQQAQQHLQKVFLEEEQKIAGQPSFADQADKQTDNIFTQLIRSLQKIN